MKSILLESIGYIDGEYLDKAENFVPEKNNVLVKWGVLAACLCLIAGGLLPLGSNLPGNKAGASGFAFTAYALDTDNKMISSEMAPGERVPIDCFESENGIRGFLFSYPFIESEQNDVPSRVILGSGELNGLSTEDVIRAALDNSMDMYRNYVLFVISSDTLPPYDFSYICPTSDPDIIYQMDLRIDEADGCYNATLVNIAEIKRVYDLPKQSSTGK